MTDIYEYIRAGISAKFIITAFDWYRLTDTERRNLGAIIAERNLTMKPIAGRSFQLETSPLSIIAERASNNGALIDDVLSNEPRSWQALNAEFQDVINSVSTDGEMTVFDYANKLGNLLEKYLIANGARDASVIGGLRNNPNIK